MANMQDDNSDENINFPVGALQIICPCGRRIIVTDPAGDHREERPPDRLKPGVRDDCPSSAATSPFERSRSSTSPSLPSGPSSPSAPGLQAPPAPTPSSSTSKRPASYASSSVPSRPPGTGRGKRPRPAAMPASRALAIFERGRGLGYTHLRLCAIGGISEHSYHSWIYGRTSIDHEVALKFERLDAELDRLESERADSAPTCPGAASPRTAS